MPNHNLFKNTFSSWKKNRANLKLSITAGIFFFCFYSYGAKNTCNVRFINGSAFSKKAKPPSERLTVNSLVVQAQSPLPETRRQAALKTRFLKTKKSVSVLNMLKNDPNKDVKKETLISAAYKFFEGGFEILNFLKTDKNPYIKALAKKTITLFNDASKDPFASLHKLPAKLEFQNTLGGFAESMAEATWLEPLEILNQKNKSAKKASNVEVFNVTGDAQNIAFGIIEDILSENVFSRLAAVYFLGEMINIAKKNDFDIITDLEYLLLNLFLEETNTDVKLAFINIFRKMKIKNTDILSIIYNQGSLNQNQQVKNAIKQLVWKARSKPFLN